MVPDQDHRKLAQRLDLLHFQDEAPGMVFWHPRGLALYRVLEQAARAHCEAQGYLGHRRSCGVRSGKRAATGSTSRPACSVSRTMRATPG